MSPGLRAVSLIVVVLGAWVAAPGVCLAQRVDIFIGLYAGTVWADFHGNGGSSVMATIGRAPGGPTEVVVPAGAVFRVAQGGNRGLQQYGGAGGRGNLGQGGRGGGRQGMYGMTTTLVSLALNSTASLILPAVCMDYGKREPTPADRMVISQPDERLARLAGAIEEMHPAQPVVQVAMWAANNKAPARVVDRYLRALPSTSAAPPRRQDLIAAAWALLELAGFDPAGMRMFQGPG